MCHILFSVYNERFTVCTLSLCLVFNALQRPNGLRLLFDPKIGLREKVVFLEEQGFSQSQIGMLTM